VAAVTLVISFHLYPYEDPGFKALRLSYTAAACLDYWTTFSVSQDLRFKELNKITNLYWRSPSLFCGIKTLELYLADRFFDFVYKKNKVLGVITVVVFTVFRVMAVKDNFNAILR